MWDVWKKLFLECIEKHAPLRTKRVRSSNSSWITPQLKKKKRLVPVSTTLGFWCFKIDNSSSHVSISNLPSTCGDQNEERNTLSSIANSPRKSHVRAEMTKKKEQRSPLSWKFVCASRKIETNHRVSFSDFSLVFLSNFKLVT